jgi:hypothetical protein
MQESGVSHVDRVAEVMMVLLMPAYAGNTQVSRKHNFKVISDPSKSDYLYVYKISDDKY